MTLEQLFHQLFQTFSYTIEMQGNSGGFVVQIWDGYGLRRANAHEGTLEESIKKALEQYDQKKEN